MSIFGRRAQTWRTKEVSFGWQMVDHSLLQIGMQASRIISVMRMVRRRTVSSYGIGMVKGWNGMIRRAVLKHILSVKCNKIIFLLNSLLLIFIFWKINFLIFLTFLRWKNSFFFCVHNLWILFSGVYLKLRWIFINLNKSSTFTSKSKKILDD